jgi:hypothetical protein
MKSAIDISRALHPDGAPIQVMAAGYGKRLLYLNKLDEAQPYFVQARELAIRWGSIEMQAVSLLGLAAVKREQGDTAGMPVALHEAQDFINTHFPPGHPQARTCCGRPRISIWHGANTRRRRRSWRAESRRVASPRRAHWGRHLRSPPDPKRRSGWEGSRTPWLMQRRPDWRWRPLRCPVSRLSGQATASLRKHRRPLQPMTIQLAGGWRPRRWPPKDWPGQP